MTIAMRRYLREGLPTAPGLQLGRVLVVEEGGALFDLLGGALTEDGYAVLRAPDCERALALASEAPPDLVVSDLEVPHLGGLELLHRLHALESTPTVPVMITSSAAADAAVRALEAGACDFVPRPCGGRELLARVRGQLARARELAAARSGSLLDPLTGLLARRGLDHAMGVELARVRRQALPLAVWALRLDGLHDGLKAAARERALVDLAAQLTCQLRRTDLIGRTGDRTLVVVLPDTALHAATCVAGRLRSILRALWVPGESRPGLTAALGMAYVDGDCWLFDDSIPALLARAERAVAETNPLIT